MPVEGSTNTIKLIMHISLEFAAHFRELFS